VKVRVWRYLVAAEHRAEFEREYGGGGSWAQLFATTPGFVDTALYADTARPGCYLTVDRFESAAAWERFQVENVSAYAELGDRLGHLTVDQQELV
jgi:hypothetical protein